MTDDSPPISARPSCWRATAPASISPVAGHPRRAGPDRAARRRGQRVLPRRRGLRALVGEGVRGALAGRRAARAAGRRPDVDQGHAAHDRLADPARLDDDQRRGPVRGRRPAGRPGARAGAVLLGKNTTPELAWKGVTDSPLTGVTTNPWNPALTAGGSSGGQRRRRRARDGAALPGHRRRRLGPDPGRVHRHRRAQADLRPDRALARQRVRHAGARRPDDPDGRRRGAAARRRVPAGHPRPVGRRRARACRPSSVSPAARRDCASRTARRSGSPPSTARWPRSSRTRWRCSAALGATVETADPGFADPIEPFSTLWYAAAAKSLEPLGPDARSRMDPSLVAIAEQGACDERAGLPRRDGRAQRRSAR